MLLFCFNPYSAYPLLGTEKGLKRELITLKSGAKFAFSILKRATTEELSQ